MDVEARWGVCWCSETGKFSPIAKFSQISDRNRPSWFRRSIEARSKSPRVASRPPRKAVSSWLVMEGEPERQICTARGHDTRTSRLPTSYRASTRAREMDRSIRAMFSGDDHALGPFLGILPPEILDVVVENLGWFRTTFAMAGRTCREAVERVPSARAVLTEKEREQMEWPETSPLAVAVMEGDVEALEWLMRLFEAMGGWRDHRLTCLAAGRGKLESLTCLRANECPWGESTCMWAAEGGHLEVLQWARRNGCPWDAYTCAEAAMWGHQEVLQWAHENGCEWNKRTCQAAARGGHLEVLQWAHENGCPWDKDTCEAAARGGHLEVLQWARQNGCPWDKKTCKAAAMGGHVEVLQWARRNGCTWHESTCEAAAKGGHLDILQWAHENRHWMNELPCAEAAAEGGHLEVLKWLHQNGCPWYKTTCEYAARGGHLEVLQWAHENGCPWDEGTWHFADSRCRPYLIEHRCPGAE